MNRRDRNRRNKIGKRCKETRYERMLNQRKWVENFCNGIVDPHLGAEYRKKFEKEVLEELNQ